MFGNHCRYKECVQMWKFYQTRCKMTSKLKYGVENSVIFIISAPVKLSINNELNTNLW